MKKKRPDFVYHWDNLPVVLDPPYAAHLLGCSTSLIRKMCQAGDLPAVKIGDMWRIPRDKLKEFCLCD